MYSHTMSLEKNGRRKSTYLAFEYLHPRCNGPMNMGGEAFYFLINIIIEAYLNFLMLIETGALTVNNLALFKQDIRSNFNSLHCIALHRTSLRLYCTAPKCDGMQCITVKLNCTTLHYTVLHCTKLYYTALNSTTLHYTAIHCNTLHYNALHCTTMHYTALH